MNLRRFLVGALALLALSAVIACGDAEIREVEVVKVVEKEVPVEVIKEVVVVFPCEPTTTIFFKSETILANILPRLITGIFFFFGFN